jgi:pimeloyl-ACP methyl ester carboxylesterase
MWCTAGMATGPSVADGSGPEVDAMITAVIDRASMPPRHREPKMSGELADAERFDVATPHGRIAAWRVGEGPAVLLVHGWQDSARLWDPLMAALRARGRAFVALDLPGHGFSEGERCLVAEVADTLLAAAAALGPVDAAVAHSFATGGTSLGVMEGAGVERLVLIAPPVAYRAPNESAGDAVDASRQRWRRIADELGFDPAVGDLALERYRASLGPSRAKWDLTDGLAQLDVDLLLLASVDDERFDVVSARALAAGLPRGVLVELTGLDHRASARAPAAVDAMVDFLEHGLSTDMRT